MEENITFDAMFSTPAPISDNSHLQLVELIEELGRQIGNSILGQLLADQSTPASFHQTFPETVKSESFSATLDLSKMNLIVWSNIREPPIFRDDGTDKYTVHEWTELMVVYLQKCDCPNAERANKILNRLLGSVKSIVKVGLKNNPSPDMVVSPETIYKMLICYFGECPTGRLLCYMAIC